MSKRGLTVGVNRYGGWATPLQAPVKEAKKWRKVLEDQYGFDYVDAVTEENATRQNVLDAIRKLFLGASTGDLLIFQIGGHGAYAYGWDSDTKFDTNRTEHAVIVYGTPDEYGFQRQSITPSDIIRLARETSLPPVKFVLIVDSCHAGRFGSGGPKVAVSDVIDPVVLFIPNAVKTDDPDEDVRTFADIVDFFIQFHTKADRSDDGAPMFFVGARDKETAVEVGQSNDRRLLFSQQAINRLNKAYTLKETISYYTLKEEINPLRKEQHADLLGNMELQQEPFGGGLKSSAAGTGAFRTQEQGAGMNAEIVVYGLATLIDNTDDNQNPSRLIFPHDPSTDPKLRHFCFIEVAANDVRGTPTIDPATRYLRGGVLYWRWILAQHRVSFGNVNGSGQPLARSNRFHTDVPRLTDVTPELKTAPYKPRPECFFELPAAGIFNAFVDFPIGAATVVDFGEVPIEFYGMTSLEVTRPGMVLPLCGRFTIPLNNDHIVLMLDGENQEHEAIYVRAGATFTIGNAREEDITGGSIDPTPSRHFLLYYKMFEETIFDPGIPREVQIPTNACVITTYP